MFWRARLACCCRSPACLQHRGRRRARQNYASDPILVLIVFDCCSPSFPLFLPSSLHRSIVRCFLLHALSIRLFSFRRTQGHIQLSLTHRKDGQNYRRCCPGACRRCCTCYVYRCHHKACRVSLLCSPLLSLYQQHANALCPTTIQLYKWQRRQEPRCGMEG